MPLGMANLRQDETGLAVSLHVFKDVDHGAGHGPRVKSYPGKPHEGRATTIAIPTQPGERARVIGLATIRGRALRDVLDFVTQHWMLLLLYWYNPDYDERDLRQQIAEANQGQQGA